MIERIVRQATSSGRPGDRRAVHRRAPRRAARLHGQGRRPPLRRGPGGAQGLGRAALRERIKPFLRLHDAILDRRDEILDLVQWETGKARRHAFEEVLDVAGCTLYYVRRGARPAGAQARAGIFPVATKTAEVRRPKGTVALISPWNYPLSLGVTDVVPALLAGNAVVHKPDTQTALSTLWTIDLLVALGMPREIWQVVLGDPAEIGDALIEDADYVAFTGSTRGGRKIAEEAAKRLIGCSLELGGKNPMIVLDGRRPGRGRAGRAARLLHQRRAAVHLHRAALRPRRRVRRVRGEVFAGHGT